MTRFALGLVLAALPAAALAAPQVSLTSHISLVKVTPGPSGKPVVSLEEPKLVTPGDKLAFTLDYVNGSGSPAANFVVTDPLPSGVVYADNASSGAEVSVDGGKSFGPLESLFVSDPAGKPRPAAAADVTHVRWTFAKPIPAGEHGKLHFDAIVK
jgi:uncharacterized repeat protein (TIGR01451 family)